MKIYKLLMIVLIAGCSPQWWSPAAGGLIGGAAGRRSAERHRQGIIEITVDGHNFLQLNEETIHSPYCKKCK